MNYWLMLYMCLHCLSWASYLADSEEYILDRVETFLIALATVGLWYASGILTLL